MNCAASSRARPGRSNCCNTPASSERSSRSRRATSVIDPRRLLAHGAQYWSQNYEDGMIAEIFRRIGVQSKTFLEIGIGDGRENNTAALVAMGWSGWWIDANKKACNLIAAPVARGARRGRPTEDPRHAKIRCEPQGIRAARRGVRLFTRRLRHHRRQCLFRAKRLVGDKFVAPFTAENHYEPQR